MLDGLIKQEATGAGAIALSAAVSAQRGRLISVTAHVGVAPASAGSLTVTLNAVAGAAYDTLLHSVSMIGVTDLVWTPDEPIYLKSGDAIDVAYANPDARTVGVQATLEVV